MDSKQISLEWAKQIITLSSGIIVISATFIGNIFKYSIALPVLLYSSWVALIIAIIFSTLFIISLASFLEQKNNSAGFGRKNVVYSKIANFSFIFAILVFLAFSVINTHTNFTRNRSKDTNKAESVLIINSNNNKVVINNKN